MSPLTGPLSPLHSRQRLSVSLHRQDTASFCGPACVQMIGRAAATLGFQAAGQVGQVAPPVATLGQQAIMERARKPPTDVICECTAVGPPVWYICPEAMARVISPETAHGYGVRATSTRTELLDVVEKSIADHRCPAVLLVDSGGHWLVIHGFRRDQAGNLYLDARDPWPPVPPTAAGAPAHAGFDCAHRNFSASRHLIFPAGIAWRLTANDIGAKFDGRYVGILTSEAEASPDVYSDPSEPPHSSVVITEAEAGESARVAYHQARLLQWIPASPATVALGTILRIESDQWSASDQAWKAETNHLVELRHPEIPERTVAIAFVASSGRFHGQTREMVVPSNGRSWVRTQAELSQEAGEVVLGGGGGGWIGAGGPPPVDPRRPLRPMVHAVPSAAGPATIPLWLTTAPPDAITVSAYWRSCSHTRSPFFPLIQLRFGPRTAWITSDRQLVEKLDDGDLLRDRPFR